MVSQRKQQQAQHSAWEAEQAEALTRLKRQASSGKAAALWRTMASCTAQREREHQAWDAEQKRMVAALRDQVRA